jgi:hypothetical protein
MRNMRLPNMLPSLALALLLSAATSAENVKKHVTTLASEEMGGRLTGTEGAEKAADYIIAELERLGALPLPGQSSYRIPFEFTAGVNDTGSSLAIGDGAPSSDGVRALAFSEVADVEGPVVFAGYGITVPESQDFGYDSYFGLDVQDKIVLVLRYFPEDASAEVKSVLARYSGLRYKAMNARERGAKGLLLVTGPRSPNAGELAALTFDTAASGSGIVAASITGEVADRLFERVPDESLEQAQAALDDANPHVSGFEIPDVRVRLSVQLEREMDTGYNVAGYFPASAEEAFADRYVLLGAHYDHLGTGAHGNSLAGKDEAGQIHRGADDNASGVAAVLSAAAWLQGRDRRAHVAFGFWSGEEMGLLGSGAFVADEVIPSEKLGAYVNFDMVGRMRDNKLVLQAVGTSEVWPRLIEQTNVPVGFDVQTSEDPYLPTDVTSFNQAEVPSINFFTGNHTEYHRPADRVELINFDDLERVIQFGALLTDKLANLDEAPEFVKVARTRQEGGSRDTVRAFTGTIPDYATEVEGLLLSGVIEGGPADEAGLQAGDVIVELAGQTITNIYDYTFALDVVKVDEPVEVVYLRDGERVTTTLTPRARK